MAMASSDVANGDNATATVYNLLRQDMREANRDTQIRYYEIGITSWCGQATADVAALDSSNGYLINADGGFAQRTFVYEVNLPYGATVTNMRIYYYRAEGVLTPSLERRKYSDNSAVTMAAPTCDDTSAAIVYADDATITSGTIDTSAYRYYVSLTWDNVNSTTLDQRVYGIVITYTTANPLP